ncbi:16S rRNA (uracil1498-N3)-methyltransferase [Alkalispirochaeta americana]|uniref:Ribosomal RNA small subunit methyltransferase E n=1 Tax=Alkalispirochaeta americana TaxID=159291 RepID=A0A1N6RZY2_9SPIO|nr:RsmE family RNA methyltransferase [Alkalispirochaeta americana]SIQ34359.1 16S rRNA (uracil1498-N3)-methyltransferase [Alkalispirochaeta americana]
MKHLVVSSIPPPGGEIHLSGRDAHYLGQVRRLRPGDSLDCTDGNGGVCRALVSVGPGGDLVLVVQKILGEDPQQPASLELPRGEVSLEVFLPLLKGKLFDKALRQVTELGADRIVPVVTRHCVKRPPREEAELRKKNQRWEVILREACQQSGRSRLPELTPVQDLPALVDGTPGIVFHERATRGLTREKAAELWVGGGSRRVLTGPEGGLAPEEVACLAEAGWLVCSLPTPVLRAETAAVAALAIVLHLGSELHCSSRSVIP